MFTLIPLAPVLLLFDRLKTLNVCLSCLLPEKKWSALRQTQTTPWGATQLKDPHLVFNKWPAIIPAEYEQTDVGKIYTLRLSPLAWVGEWLRGLFLSWECWHWPDGLRCELKCKLVKSRWLPRIRPSLYAVSLDREIPEVFWIRADWNISPLRFPWRGGKHSQGAVHVGSERVTNRLSKALWLLWWFTACHHELSESRTVLHPANRFVFFPRGSMQVLSNTSPKVSNQFTQSREQVRVLQTFLVRRQWWTQGPSLMPLG